MWNKEKQKQKQEEAYLWNHSTLTSHGWIQERRKKPWW